MEITTEQRLATTTTVPAVIQTNCHLFITLMVNIRKIYICDMHTDYYCYYYYLKHDNVEDEMCMVKK